MLFYGDLHNVYTKQQFVIVFIVISSVYSAAYWIEIPIYNIKNKHPLAAVTVAYMSIHSVASATVLGLHNKTI